MVEFLRDVIVAVALLATLIAVALHPAAEADRHSETTEGKPAVTVTEPGSGMVAYNAKPQAPRPQ